MNVIHAFLDVFLESAPWLILGLLVAGLLKEFVPMSWMEKQLGRRSRFGVIKAAIIGAPLPLCSCGVIPAAAGLRRAGASKGATTSFLISTPETGVDSIALSWVLLGPFMAIIRPIAAIFSAITAGWLVGKDDDDTPEQAPMPKASSCCSSHSCGSKNAAKTPQLSVWQRGQRGMHYASTEMVDDIALWLVVGITFAALIQAYVPESFLAQWGNGILAMLVMVVISIPMYICATASTPIAAGLLVAGVSPGAVLVFMLAGPATNIATLGVVNKLLGKRALWSYLSAVLFCALAFGWFVDWLFMTLNWQLSVVDNLTSDHQVSAIAAVCAVVLAVLIGVSLGKSLMKRTAQVG